MKLILTLSLLILVNCGLLAQDTYLKQDQLPNEKRIALVIGNSDYTNGKLKNPVNDANLISDSLQKLGFVVIKQINAKKAELEKAVYDFSKRLPSNNIALFYYAGHGIQADGVNYLLPVDAELTERGDVKFQAIPVNFITEEFEKYPNSTNIVILDACRNNPFRSWMRGLEIGFKAISNQTAGSIIAYATRENATASDGSGNNGLYTRHLVREMMKPQTINDVFMNTRIAVLEDSKYSQCPQEWNMLIKQFYFKLPDNQEKIISAIIPQNINNLVSGIFFLYPEDPGTENCKVGEFEIYDVVRDAFKIRGIGQDWKGNGIIHNDNTGRYDWIFDDGRKGSTYIKINSHGSINGSVVGANTGADPLLNWVYVAYPIN
ncbi:MAG: caspase family protein [Chitinophagaceae bacterium]